LREAEASEKKEVRSGETLERASSWGKRRFRRKNRTRKPKSPEKGSVFDEG